MPTDNGRKRLNGVAPVIIRYVSVILAAVFAMGLLYAEVMATGKKTDENRARVEAIEQSINEMVVEQKVLIQRFDDEKEKNKEFRYRTGNALDRILERLPRREGPAR